MNFTNLFKNRMVLGITCIILSLVICFVISPLLSSSQSKNITVVRATREIKSGDEITKDMVQEVSMTSVNQPNSSIKKSNEVIGKFSTMDMIKGDYVLAEKLSEIPISENTYLNSLDGTKRAISITIKSFADGLSGKIKSGDIVSVIAPNYKRTGLTVIPTELQYVEVIAATSKTGADTGDGKTETDQEKELPATVTLLVSESQAKILAEINADGSMHLSLVYRGAKENAEKFLQAQYELNGKTNSLLESGAVSNEGNR